MEDGEPEHDGVLDLVGEGLVPDWVEGLRFGGRAIEMVLVDVQLDVRVEYRLILPELALFVRRPEPDRLVDLDLDCPREHPGSSARTGSPDEKRRAEGRTSQSTGCHACRRAGSSGRAIRLSRIEATSSRVEPRIEPRRVLLVVRATVSSKGSICPPRGLRKNVSHKVGFSRG